METAVYNMQGKEVEKISLDKDIFEGEINQAVLREAVLAHEAARRQGTASTKSRGEVRGGGKKPWAQKGTGRARAGSIRSPLWVGGGVTFGPKPRSFRYSLPRKVKRLALKFSLRKRLKEGSLLVLDKVSVKKGKTREMVELLQSLGLKGKTLLILDKWDEKIIRSSSNLKNLTLCLSSIMSGPDILSHHNLCLTKKALNTIVERLKNE